MLVFDEDLPARHRRWLRNGRIRFRAVGRDPRGGFTNPFTVEADLSAALAGVRTYLEKRIHQ